MLGWTEPPVIGVLSLSRSSTVPGQRSAYGHMERSGPLAAVSRWPGAGPRSRASDRGHYHSVSSPSPSRASTVVLARGNGWSGRSTFRAELIGSRPTEAGQPYASRVASAGTFIEYASKLSRDQRDLQLALAQPPFAELREGRTPTEHNVPAEAASRLQLALASMVGTFAEIERDDELWGVLSEVPRADAANALHKDTLDAIKTRIEGLRALIAAPAGVPELAFADEPEDPDDGASFWDQVSELRSDLATFVEVANAAVASENVYDIYERANEAESFADTFIETFSSVGVALLPGLVVPHIGVPVLAVAAVGVGVHAGIKKARQKFRTWKRSKAQQAAGAAQVLPAVRGPTASVTDSKRILAERLRSHASVIEGLVVNGKPVAAAGVDLQSALRAVSSTLLQLAATRDAIRESLRIRDRQGSLHARAHGVQFIRHFEADFDNARDKVDEAVTTLVRKIRDSTKKYPIADAADLATGLSALAGTL